MDAGHSHQRSTTADVRFCQAVSGPCVGVSFLQNVGVCWCIMFTKSSSNKLWMSCLHLQYMDVVCAWPRELATFLSFGKRICAVQYAHTANSGPCPDPAALHRFKKGSKRRRGGGAGVAAQGRTSAGASLPCAEVKSEMPSQCAQSIPNSKLCEAEAQVQDAHATYDMPSIEFPPDAEGTHAMRREIDNKIQLDQAFLCAKSGAQVGRPAKLGTKPSVLAVGDVSRAKRTGRRARPLVQDPAFE